MAGSRRTLRNRPIRRRYSWRSEASGIFRISCRNSPAAWAKNNALAVSRLMGWRRQYRRAPSTELNLFLEVQLLQPPEISVGLVELVHHPHVPVAQLLAAEMERR